MKHPQIEVKTRSLGLTKISENDRLVFKRERLDSEDFSGRKLIDLTAVGSKFVSCRFENMRIKSGCFGAGREVSEYIDCSFDGSSIRMIPVGYARFERCSFRNTDIHDWICFAVEMVGCTFSGKMRHVILNGTPQADDQAVVHRERNEFRGNDFSEAKLEDLSFRTGIDLTQQKLPIGPEYVYVPNAENAVRQARAEILEWKDIELRRLSMVLISTFEEEIQAGQQQILFRAADYTKSLRRSADAVFALLKKYSEA